MVGRAKRDQGRTMSGAGRKRAGEEVIGDPEVRAKKKGKYTCMS